jgi:putative hydrolase of HD superfamily
MRAERATAILDFLAVADRLKTVERRGRVVLPDGATRRENSAEHCWSLALIGLLPPDLGARLRALWEEFEAAVTPEARFAMACDRMQGFFQNVLSGGQAWREHGVTRADTLPRMGPAMAVDPAFAALIGRLYDQAEDAALLGPRA